MKKAAFKAGLILALVFAAWRFGQAQTQLADFRINIEAASGGAKLECLRGCAWKTLSFGCDGKQECRAQVDQTGVGPVGR